MIMYTHVIDEIFGGASILLDDKSIPLDPANSDYQRVLDDIIEQGADCFEGDIPQDLLDAAEAKQLLTDS